MKKSAVGLIGLGVMGSNLARNIAKKGYSIVVYNRTTATMEKFVIEFGGQNIRGASTIKNFVDRLEIPRIVFILVKAGTAIDDIITELLPLLSEGDILIDGGNSYYKDTISRSNLLSKSGIHFIGCGISGGAKGALEGPSLMPGGSEISWKHLKPLFQSIAARDFQGNPCVTHVGPDGAGHYMKMIHNGIEYAMLQTIAEAYDLLKKLFIFSPDQTAHVFEQFNQGKLESYLLEISIPILCKKDSKTGGFLIDWIQDVAEQKGTGKWMVQDALERGVSVPSIAASVFARMNSAAQSTRILLSKRYPKGKMFIEDSREVFLKKLENALYGAWLSIFAQGFELMKQASSEQQWSIVFSEIARIWQGGSIIRTKLLKDIEKSLSSNNSNNFYIFDQIYSIIPAWKEVINLSIQKSIPTPALTSSLQYIETLTSDRLPANIIQALRDCFGSHGYKRIDQEGIFHIHWNL